MTEPIPEPIDSEEIVGQALALNLDAPIYDIVQHSAPAVDSATTIHESE